MSKKWDFCGYATKNNLKCSDGRVIRADAFKHQDGLTVPLVWQHLHDSVDNILGHALLENREDGVYAYGKFNDNEAGRKAKALVDNGDISDLSILANKLVQKGTDVVHGMIREVSLVLAGANPGAKIENTAIEHSDGSIIDIDDEAIISMGLGFESDKDEPMQHADEGGTVEDMFNSFSPEQKEFIFALIGDITSGENMEQSDNLDGGATLKHNVFEGKENTKDNVLKLSDDQILTIFEDAKKCGSLKESILSHADEYGITNIELLFPDAQMTDPHPEWIKRETDWVATVLNEATHSPFSRIKTMYADITHDEARAKGYTKGHKKKDEFFSLLKRTTQPTTVYKKQKLDRDDIIDITNFDVVAWIKGEMRMMLNEEIARAILIGDGREVDDEDKIDETCIRPIAQEDDLYAIHYLLPDGATGDDEIEAVMTAMDEYKGVGSPKLYTTRKKITEWKKIKDKNDRRIYNNETEIADVMGVSSFVRVPLLENFKHKYTPEGGTEEEREVVGIIINMKDYKIGTDKGGQITSFDDFDIDYNQYKYLMEGRMSGAIHRMKSAIILERKVTSGTPTRNILVDE